MKAYILGMLEFRSQVTSSFDGNDLELYDKGRELMHKITFRMFEF